MQMTSPKKIKMCSFEHLSQRRHAENQSSEQIFQKETRTNKAQRKGKEVNNKEKTKNQLNNKYINNRKKQQSQIFIFGKVNKVDKSFTRLIKRKHKLSIIKIKRDYQYRLLRHLKIIKEYYDNFVLVSTTIWLKYTNFLGKKKKKQKTWTFP